MLYSIEDIRRIVGAKNVGRVRTLLCRAEFEKKRNKVFGTGKRLTYFFDAQDLKEFKEAYNSLSTMRVKKQNEN